ncbi:putative invertase/pectin methylesterase inhibitor domain superfamily [Helianthus annuus]|nr:putative invertase/pectin methylesterase inhibitor domain superfamily [Helianthus annuus]
MKTQIPIIIFLLSTTLTTITTTTTTSNPLPPSPSPQPNESNDKDFIRTSCKTTLYPQTCFTSLSGYSVLIKTCDPKFHCIMQTSCTWSSLFSLFVSSQ